MDLKQCVLLLSCLVLVSCTCQKPQLTRIEQIVMHVPLCVQLPGPLSTTQYEEVERAIATVFERIDTIYNPWNPHSEISHINAAPAWLPISLSDELALFLKQTGELVALTEGRFDPTVAPLHRLWIESLENHTVPSSSAIEERRAAVGWHHLSLMGNILYKKHPLTAIDLCAIAKGFAVDELVVALQRCGYHNVYVEWGGEVKTAGHHPTGRPWRVEVLKTTILECCDQAVATSGDYYQNWTVCGETYSHILDPHRHVPLKRQPHSIASASVVHSSCMVADALSTALMLFDSADDALAWFAHHSTEGEAWVIESATWENPECGMSSSMPPLPASIELSPSVPSLDDLQCPA